MQDRPFPHYRTRTWVRRCESRFERLSREPGNACRFFQMLTSRMVDSANSEVFAWQLLVSRLVPGSHDLCVTFPRKVQKSSHAVFPVYMACSLPLLLTSLRSTLDMMQLNVATHYPYDRLIFEVVMVRLLINAGFSRLLTSRLALDQIDRCTFHSLASQSSCISIYASYLLHPCIPVLL